MSFLKTNWRDVDAWRKEGLPLSTTSNEAAKMYDATLSQFTAYASMDSIGGLEGSVTKMLEADPEFIMGHVLATEMRCRNSMDTILSLAAKQSTSNREKLHIEALKERLAGNIIESQNICDDILVEYPTDMFALKMITEYSIYFGAKERIADVVARVLPKWSKETPLYGYLYGLHAFGLEEANFFREAEVQARKGLELVPQDAMATHALIHVMESEGRQDEGIAHYSKTFDDWSLCEVYACHNYWHWALFHVEKGEYETALEIYDSNIAPKYRDSIASFSTDGADLLYRLNLEGVDVGERWQQLCPFWESHIYDHEKMFRDCHMLMSALGAKDEALALEVMRSLRDFVRDGSGTNWEITREVGIPVCEAVIKADKGNFAGAVDILKPLRYKFGLIGGSRVQFELFNLSLIHAAMLSHRKEDRHLARSLLTERKAKKQNSPMLDRLMERALVLQTE